MTGTVRRGRRPEAAQVLARREHSLVEVLTAANQHSDNLAAETLVRALSFLPDPPDAAPSSKQSPGNWSRGLEQLRRALNAMGLHSFELGNGSGLHRRAWVTARTLVQLLEGIQANAALRKLLLPTLAVAGKSGTLAPRLRGGGAEGHLFAKTGTLGGALALSGLVDPDGNDPAGLLAAGQRPQRPGRARAHGPHRRAGRSLLPRPAPRGSRLAAFADAGRGETPSGSN